MDKRRLANYKLAKTKVKGKEGNVRNPLNSLSKYKIFDNLRRSLIEISVIVSMIVFVILGNIYHFESYPYIIISLIAVVISNILEIFNNMLVKKEGEHQQKNSHQKYQDTEESFENGNNH